MAFILMCIFHICLGLEKFITALRHSACNIYSFFFFSPNKFSPSNAGQHIIIDARDYFYTCYFFFFFFLLVENTGAISSVRKLHVVL